MYAAPGRSSKRNDELHATRKHNQVMLNFMHAAMHAPYSRPTQHAGELRAALLAANKGDMDDAQVEAAGGGARLHKPHARPRRSHGRTKWPEEMMLH